MTAAPTAPATIDQVDHTAGCDSCGVGLGGVPIRLADHLVLLVSGRRLYICNTHKAAHGHAMVAQGAAIIPIDR
ncbi:hypothetical protein DVS28_b0252 (plasmid) [Euzebya pacifica]|uniref:Uncharacterized protein n=1 Tax=Euzebya pacifica TaxID=1608957 RepID=A0A346Y6C5_9ACTN|nr:hypothetical protein [Euzebya pacifica]AXV10022.1 hypothetical protein DVS28_b0252 [Euzebya pacifica]